MAADWASLRDGFGKKRMQVVEAEKGYSDDRREKSRQPADRKLRRRSGKRNTLDACVILIRQETKIEQLWRNCPVWLGKEGAVHN